MSGANGKRGKVGARRKTCLRDFILPSSLRTASDLFIRNQHKRHAPQKGMPRCATVCSGRTRLRLAYSAHWDRRFSPSLEPDT